jgi:MFS family permease
LLAHPGLRLLGTTLTVLLFFEGMADVLAVVVVLDLLGLGEGAVGYMNASWGIGALLAGGALAVMIHRSQLSLAIGGGSALAGAGAALVAGWPVAAAAFIAWFAFGAGYTFVEVAAKTFSQRLGTDEQLARVFGFLETARLTAMALGSIVAPLLVALVGARGAVLAAGALLAAFALTRWVALKSFETGAPVDPDRFSLLRENEIFRPLPVDTLERLCHDLEPVQFEAGADVVTQGAAGERFYLIASGEVEVFVDGIAQRRERRGESFGEIALIRDVPRAATVKATCTTTLLSLNREKFIGAVTGQPRSAQLTEAVIDGHLGGDGATSSNGPDGA